MSALQDIVGNIADNWLGIEIHDCVTEYLKVFCDVFQFVWWVKHRGVDIKRNYGAGQIWRN